MSSASGTGEATSTGNGPDRATAADASPAAGPGRAGTDPVLAAEREHLRKSREYLRLMREDVLSLPALAGDRVSAEYLKADLYRRAEALRDSPDAPLFFGRLDYAAGERLHIGRRHVHDPDGQPAVIDWRAPVSRPFYRASPAEPMG
ncbi:MAG: AAA family ATPase, partial [Actinobacteria bacterium]|nr:AAA family ATPase [Actinomycetota bacterium]